MAEERSDLGYFERCWEKAKIEVGSNALKKFDATVDFDSIQTLANYERKTRGSDSETKVDDRLLKYNIAKIIPAGNKEQEENSMEMYLITDNQGHDIGIYYPDTNKFELSPKIKNHNDKIIKEFQGQAKDFLELQYSIDTLDELKEKLSNGDDIALSSKEQAVDDISEEYGLNFEQDKKQDEEEKETLEKIPADMRGEAVDLARKNGSKIKEILVVDNPKDLSKKIDNREKQISPDGGAVVLIRTSHEGADSLGDDVYVFQDGNVTHSEKNDDILEDLMDQHRDEGQVQTVTDYEGISLKEEVEKIIEEANAKIIEYEKMKRYDIESEDQEEVMKYYDEKIADVVAQRDSELQKLARKRYPLPPFDEKGIDEIEKKTQEEPVGDRGEKEVGQDDNGEHSERTIYEGHENGQSPYAS